MDEPCANTLAFSIFGSTFTKFGSRATGYRSLLNSIRKSSVGPHFLLLGSQPQNDRTYFIGPYVLNEKLCASFVVSGPSADGVPLSTDTLIVESYGRSSTARNATHRPG